MVLVAQQGNVDAAEAAVLARRRRPRQQTELRVDRREHDLCVTLLKLLGGLRVGDDFGGAVRRGRLVGWLVSLPLAWSGRREKVPDEGPGHGDEGQHEPFAFVVFERDICHPKAMQRTKLKLSATVTG